MARGLNVISGQVYGKVDWVTSDKREVGMFLKTSDRTTTRCIILGDEVEAMTANHLLEKGVMATAHGEFHARCFYRKEEGRYEGEVVCTATRIVAEPPKEGRLRGAVYANLKGVIMHWDPKMMQLKTFFNYTELGKPTQLTCSLFMKPWLLTMSEAGRLKFAESVRVGREFTAATIVEVGSYPSRGGEQVPCLQLLPIDFKLQG